ncbi:MAG: hypothetical protein ACK5II_01680 [Paracoccus sp. (in: a-proteobacteria)]
MANESKSRLFYIIGGIIVVLLLVVWMMGSGGSEEPPTEGDVAAGAIESAEPTADTSPIEVAPMEDSAPADTTSGAMDEVPAN